MKTTKRLVGLFVALVMVVSCFATLVSADPSSTVITDVVVEVPFEAPEVGDDVVETISVYSINGSTSNVEDAVRSIEFDWYCSTTHTGNSGDYADGYHEDKFLGGFSYELYAYLRISEGYELADEVNITIKTPTTFINAFVVDNLNSSAWFDACFDLTDEEFVPPATIETINFSMNMDSVVAGNSQKTGNNHRNNGKE